ncbi:hypothetical protein M23134_05087 [Microscilla marina ATCC 23134]|uniref:Lipoprotein n=2 Tax=Microscilla marina TaxID=1027 RepID=A1ZD42_MICM2|nr:hypothetical protein M23134_05087 [Microscilla marina ATCC 23134]
MFAPSLFAQSLSSPVNNTDAKAQQIIDRYLQAIGGRDNLAKVVSWKIFGKYKNKKIEGSMKTTIKYDKVRMDMEAMGQHFVQAYDGVDTWEVNPMENGGKPRYALNAKISALTTINKFYPMFLIGRDRNLAVYDSTGTWQGKQVQVLHYGKGVKQKVYYFDSKTGLLLYRQSFESIVYIQGYTHKEDASGLYLPTGVKTDTPNGVWVIDSIWANPEVADNIFAYDGETSYSSNQFAHLINEGKTLEPDLQFTAEQIVARYIKLHAKSEKGIENVKMECTVFFNGSKKGFPMHTILLLKENKSYMEMKLEDKVFKSVKNGKVSWEVNPFKSKEPKIIKKEENNDFDFSDKELVHYKKNGHEVKYISRVYIGKKLCHKIALMQNKNKTTYFYLDAKTYVMVKNKDKDSEEEGYCLEYERKDGQLLPKLVYMIQEEGMHMIVKVDKYTFNAPVNHQLFEFPGRKK